MLTADDFGAFFQEVHGYPPFPWQQRLLAQVAAGGEWPGTLDLPTGSGKTAAIDIALFHLALEADRGAPRRAPVRIAFVVDRRLVVDDAYERAKGIADAAHWSQLADDEAEAFKQRLSAEKRSDDLGRLERVRAGTAARRVAQRLALLSGDGPPLIARRLRGGIPREDDWARTPSQPTVLCSTVDQVGSRLLFRGYGVSDSMKPVHAGLIGSDCLILLDEAHLAEPFRQTLRWVRGYREKQWRNEDAAGPWQVALLTATPGDEQNDDGCPHQGKPFALGEDDRSHPVLKRRLEAAKPAFLIAPAKSKTTAETGAGTDDEGATGSRADEATRRASALVDQTLKALAHFKDAKNGAPRPAIGVVANRVGRARAIFKRLLQENPEAAENGEQSPDIILMIGPARPIDRDDLVEKLHPIRTRVWGDNEDRALDRPLVVVATQCIEAGVDIDLDALITEAAPIDSLRQRFGRLNRAGRRIEPYAAIVADRTDLSARADDPVYGKAIKAAWDYLAGVAEKENGALSVDFGIDKMDALTPPDHPALTEKPDAPVLLPAHLDLLSQTSPIPAADPDIALYLHGPAREPDSITIVWRADIDPAWGGQDLVRLLTLVPPRSREAIELPLWTVRRWLDGRRNSAADVADVPTRRPDDDEGRERRRIFRWKGDDERSQWIDPFMLRPGDTVIVPASYGGVDAFGWNPESSAPAADVAQQAAEAFAQKKFAVRVAPGLTGPHVSDETLAGTLAGLRAEDPETVRQTLLDLELPAEVGKGLGWLGEAKGWRGKPRIIVDFDLHGETAKGEPRGVVLLAPFGVRFSDRRQVADHGEDGGPNSTEDDTAGSVFDFPLSLQQHSRDVEDKARELAKRAGLPAERIADLQLAGFLHDQGKRDPRFQAWLHFGDPLGFEAEDENDILAKSGRTLPPAAREKAGLPDRWRHEALSVRLALTHPRFAAAHDPDLVLCLVGTHHGYGRPFFPHRDPEENTPEVGPQSLAFDWQGLDWPSLFARLKAHYGVWELARMEAILRLADHRASQEARDRTAKEIGE
ncbi:MAG TPA: type I-U CRISPR-associated helicase/endonuclease Cas3 [Stellaceae bacterium]|nr:type I-U CRISPR-associated helicase/endonuclease Cas3 [Stellaceae bacterium]